MHGLLGAFVSDTFFTNLAFLFARKSFATTRLAILWCWSGKYFQFRELQGLIVHDKIGPLSLPQIQTTQ